MVSSRLALNRDLWCLWRWINTRQAIEISELSLQFGIQLRFKQLKWLKWLRRLRCSWACHVEVSVSRVANTSGSRAFAWHTFGSLPQWLGQAFSATRSRDVQSGSLRVSSQQTNRTFRRVSESRLGNISLVQVLCNAGDLQLTRSISVLTGRERLCRKFTCNAGPTQWAVDATGYFDCFPSGAVFLATNSQTHRQTKGGLPWQALHCTWRRTETERNLWTGWFPGSFAPAHNLLVLQIFQSTLVSLRSCKVFLFAFAFKKPPTNKHTPTRPVVSEI